MVSDRDLLLLAVTPHADLTSSKSSSGRSKGQPAMSDCSGKAGMVDAGNKAWIEAGSGLGSARDSGGTSTVSRMRFVNK